jgi:hypothetical protein
MSRVDRLAIGHALLALAIVPGLAESRAQAQGAGSAPPSATAPVIVPTPRTAMIPAASSTMTRSAYASPARPRVYVVPPTATSQTRHRLHYGYWPARREVFLAKPWLRPD